MSKQSSYVSVARGVFGSGDCPDMPLALVTFSLDQGTGRTLTQRAVAIRALEWRLRVSVTIDMSPCARVRIRNGQEALGQSPLPGIRPTENRLQTGGQH